MIDIRAATKSYENWLGNYVRLIPEDLEEKHARMKEGAFPFFRATFYRWAQTWPETCGELARAPVVLSVGDIHIENFGTWRDADGRLVWGINDFDEAWPLPYASDLVRLAASAVVAIKEEQALRSRIDEACHAILSGYAEAMESGGGAFVLEEQHLHLRKLAVARLADPGEFWRKVEKLPAWKGRVPKSARKALERALPERRLDYRIVHRIAGLGSLGRERLATIAPWRGAWVAREAKAMAPSACAWAGGVKNPPKPLCGKILARAVRCPDPFLSIGRKWVVRRLSPSSSRIELGDLPREREERRLLEAMGAELANVHHGSGKRRAILRDLKGRPKPWLLEAARAMSEAVEKDWKIWKRG